MDEESLHKHPALRWSEDRPYQRLQRNFRRLPIGLSPNSKRVITRSAISWALSSPSGRYHLASQCMAPNIENAVIFVSQVAIEPSCMPSFKSFLTKVSKRRNVGVSSSLLDGSRGPKPDNTMHFPK